MPELRRCRSLLPAYPKINRLLRPTGRCGAGLEFYLGQLFVYNRVGSDAVEIEGAIVLAE